MIEAVMVRKNIFIREKSWNTLDSAYYKNIFLKQYLRKKKKEKHFFLLIRKKKKKFN